MPDPEARTVDSCGKLREACRTAIFEHLDTKFEPLQKVVADINGSLNYIKGQANGRAEAGSAPTIPTPRPTKRFSWKEVAAAIIIVCSAIFSLAAVFRGETANPAQIKKAVTEALEEERAESL